MNLLGRIGGDDHGLIMRDQRIAGAVAHIRFGRDIRHFATLCRTFLHMLHIIQPGAVEGARDNRYLDLHRGKIMLAAGFLIAVKRAAGDFQNAVAFQNAIAGAVFGGEANPTHD